MMLARVADSLYWLGRYAERAEHLSRLAVVMLNAALDQTDAAAARIALAAVGQPPLDGGEALDAAKLLVLDRNNSISAVSSLASARENARQIRDQITTESWERLNILYLRATGVGAEAAFASDPADFLQRIIADLHQFKGAAEATMSHGEGWRFMRAGVHSERAQLIARLLRVCFGEDAATAVDHITLMNLLRMACALEPYLRVYTADISARYILEFLIFDHEFPRSIRYCTAQLEEHLSQLSHGQGGRSEALRLAGRLNARLQYADIGEVASHGASALLAAVGEECAAIHAAIHETFVAYPLEMSLPA